jgi:cyclophilin family peptidyl-prolyl cis-trans isomerase/HEAT repeat protein
MPPRLSAIAFCLALGLCPRPSACQTATASPVDTAALQRVLTAEDARGSGPDGLAPLLAALGGRDPLLRRVAIRGLGRLQRPELGRTLLPSLSDSLPLLRAEAANAIAQSMRGVQRRDTTSDSTRLSLPQAQAALTHALATESDSAVVDALAQSLGRLPLSDSAAARQAEVAIRSRLATRITPGMVHGLYTLARARRGTGNLEPASLAQLRSAAVTSPDTVVRRLALLTLAAADGLDSPTAMHAARDQDDETRRVVLRGSGALSAQLRASLVHRALSDPSSIVRIEAVAAARLGDQPPDCTPILNLTKDADPYVVLAAIDSLDGGCADRPAVAAALRRLALTGSTKGPPDHRWQVPSHALLSLARLDSSAVATLLPRMARSKRWEARMYAAHAAAVTASRPVLFRLAGDPDHNVQEAAIAGLDAIAGHEADSVYLRALGSSGNQVVLAAATALKGSPHPRAVADMLDAFDRLTALRSENTKDPRVALLQRIGELGSTSNAARLRPYLADFDTVIATMTATTLTKWTGDTVKAKPAPLPIRAEPLAEIFLRRDIRLRVTMAPSSGGGSFTVRLFPDEAPATVARVLRLVQEGFYDGKVFQRVEPNFVIQGGGPDANEYVGDTRFMRDELTPRTHARGTLGISARGRDTGDGQWFINLVDNPLLDHEYTVFGRIDSGQTVAERILEGDRMERVVVVESE